VRGNGNALEALPLTEESFRVGVPNVIWKKKGRKGQKEGDPRNRPIHTFLAWGKYNRGEAKGSEELSGEIDRAFLKTGR